MEIVELFLCSEGTVYKKVKGEVYVNGVVIFIHPQLPEV